MLSTISVTGVELLGVAAMAALFVGWVYERAKHGKVHAALVRVENAADVIHEHMVDMHSSVLSEIDDLHNKLDEAHDKIDTVKSGNELIAQVTQSTNDVALTELKVAPKAPGK